MHQFAQTNLQLYAQVRRADWLEADVRQIHAAYEFALSVFAGHFRPNQKPFLAHLVGVASILVECQVDSKVVLAGLLHSIYSHGEFGDGLRGISRRKRQAVQQVVGVESEAIIERYDRRRLDLRELDQLNDCGTPLPPLDEAAVLIKLADVLEDHLDDGMQYSPRKELPEKQDKKPDWQSAAIELAIRLRSIPLVSGLCEAFMDQQRPQIPAFLQTKYAGSFVLAPKSHRARASMMLGRICHRFRVKLKRVSTDSRNRAA